MGFLRFIWKDIRSLRLAVKVASLIFGMVLIVAVSYLGADWWTRPVNVAPWYVPPRMRPRVEFYGVISGLILVYCLARLIGRYRNSR
jgi:hypothetical protein